VCCCSRPSHPPGFSFSDFATAPAAAAAVAATRSRSRMVLGESPSAACRRALQRAWQASSDEATTHEQLEVSPFSHPRRILHSTHENRTRAWLARRRGIIFHHVVLAGNPTPPQSVCIGLGGTHARCSRWSGFFRHRGPRVVCVAAAHC